LEATKIDATWNSLRFKVRHLKLAWRKAENFCKSTGAGIEEEDSETTIEGNIYILKVNLNYLKYFRSKNLKYVSKVLLTTINILCGKRFGGSGT